MVKKTIDLTGQKFGRLVVVDREGSNKHKKAIWLCRCECGNTTVVVGSDLRSGHTKSCGCLENENRVRGANTKHGFSHKERLYKTWENMKNRCNTTSSSDFENYGGRGIKICKPWYDYAIFRKWAYDNGYNDNLTIERINSNDDYKPSNCKWIPNSDQSKNTSQNIHVTAFGETKILSEWAKDKRCRIKYNALYYRIKKLKLNPEDAMTMTYKEVMSTLKN